MEQILFYFFSGLAIASALGVILQTRPTRALLALIVTMASIAILFVLLGAPFLAMVHIIVYAGAVLVLFLFVIMLQGIEAKSLTLKDRFPKLFTVAAVISAMTITSCLVCTFKHKVIAGPATSGMIGSANEIGMILFTKYLYPFELTSVLLLLGVFAAVALAKKDAS